MIVSQGKYVLQRKWAYMSRVSINYLRVKKVIEAFNVQMNGNGRI